MKVSRHSHSIRPSRYLEKSESKHSHTTQQSQSSNHHLYFHSSICVTKHRFCQIQEMHKNKQILSQHRTIRTIIAIIVIQQHEERYKLGIRRAWSRRLLWRRWRSWFGGIDSNQCDAMDKCTMIDWINLVCTGRRVPVREKERQSKRISDCRER